MAGQRRNGRQQKGCQAKSKRPHDKNLRQKVEIATRKRCFVQTALRVTGLSK
jgi:hypothetical protein